MGAADGAHRAALSFGQRGDARERVGERGVREGGNLEARALGTMPSMFAACDTTAGNPQASASSTAFGNPSHSDGSTATSAA